MRGLILTAIAVLFSTLILWAQTGAPAPAAVTSESTGAHKQQHNKQHSKQHTHHPNHHTSISARR